ncbi:MAG: glutaredoxin family protein [Burkholderiales bacterium]|nr:glutaredoxin family protein [Burkholderiales bacterium]
MSPLARPALAAALVAVLAAWVAPAGAQQIYRIVGPDGRVTFSDRPPPDAAGRATMAPVVTLQGGDAANAALPFELRTATSKYPVTLYSRPGCNPCDAGRRYLVARGIPYAERTITSNEDIEALQRLTGTPTLPMVTIGVQQLKGFSEVEWAQFLDAAGYPRTSMLPATYRQPPAAPLVAAASAAPPPAAPGATATDTPPAAQSPSPSGQAPANPAGIQF